MKKALIVLLILSAVFLAGFVLADGNSSQSNSTVGGNNTQSNVTEGNSTNIGICKDSDGGLSYFVKGQTTRKNPDANSTSSTLEDSCLNSKTLSEGYCEDNQIKTQKYDCPNECNNGACVTLACTSPACDGAYYTGRTSLNGCPIYACPTSNVTSNSRAGDYDSCLNNPDNWYDQETGKCFPGFSKEIIAQTCSDPDGGINKYKITHTFGFRSVFADSKDQRIRTGGKDSCIGITSDRGSTGETTTSGSGGSGSTTSTRILSQMIEHYCDENGYIQTTYLACPNGCNQDGCIKGIDVKESITCYFENTKTEQQCYTGDVAKAECSGLGSCTTSLEAEKGEKITWKSSCGGYQYTLQDGDDEKVVFDCAIGETNSTNVESNAFRNAYWQCYDGKEFNMGDESSCKPYGLWKKYATEACEARCSSGKEKCGVNSFSMSNPCYSDSKDEQIDDDVKSYNQSTEAKIAIDALICKDSCPLDDKCYPFGYRKSEKFCSDSGAFTEQLKADLKCENNFECGSNVCVSGQCVSEGTIEKILNWFKKLFGGE